MGRVDEQPRLNLGIFPVHHRLHVGDTERHAVVG
jgi:hypothetical protein